MTLLGPTIDAFPIGLGSNTFGWTADAVTSLAILDAYREAGGNLIDTADVYSVWASGNSGGEAEALIGRWVAASGARSEVILASKVSGHPNHPGLSSTNIKDGVERSLERLRTDYLDIYFAHYDDPSTPIVESAAAFSELVDQGLVRHVGLSNLPAPRIREWLDIAMSEGLAVPTVLQPNYNLLNREAFETTLLPIVEQYRLTVMPYFGLASGFLTGKYRNESEVARSPRSAFLAPYANAVGFALVEVLIEIAVEVDAAPATVALAWLRQQAGVTTPLASVSRVDQLDTLIAAASLKLSPEALSRLSEASAP